MSYTPEALKDVIVSLPRSGEFLSRQFSGFLRISSTKNIHYFYVESENNPASDPLIFWTNGGPGCSGLLGLFTEMGPWRPMADGSLANNPSSWTRNASMVFLEQPVGVGFSYTSSRNFPTTSDFQSAADNVAVVKEFFNRFPERRSNDYYLAAESYGGHYIPQWTIALFNFRDPALDLLSSFKGFILGNPYVNFGSGSIAMANALWGLQLVPKSIWSKFTKSRCHLMGGTVLQYSNKCWDLLDQLFLKVEALNPYALSYPVCVKDGSSRLSQGNSYAWKQQTHFVSRQSKQLLRLYKRQIFQQLQSHNNSKLLPKTSREDKDMEKSGIWSSDYRIGTQEFETFSNRHLDRLDWTQIRYPLTAALPYDPCTEDYLIAYLNDQTVQSALHVLEAFVYPWSTCSDPVFEKWSIADQFADTTKLYSAIEQHPRKPADFKMLIFSGDNDGVCATVGTQAWIYNVFGSEDFSKNFFDGNATSPNLWQPWYLGNSEKELLGGYATRLTSSLAFVTVRGAGHEVPAYQPLRAAEMLSHYFDRSFFVDRTEILPAQQPTAPPADNSANEASGSMNRSLRVLFGLFGSLILVGMGIFGLHYIIRWRRRYEGEGEKRKDVEVGAERYTAAGTTSSNNGFSAVPTDVSEHDGTPGSSKP